MDRELRNLKEEPQVAISAADVAALVTECLAQKERQSSRGAVALLESWIVTPRASVFGAAGSAVSSLSGATSLAGPCIDNGSRWIGAPPSVSGFGALGVIEEESAA